MKIWDARSLKNLHGVHPDLRRVMDRALQDAPFAFVVTEGMRTLARQRELVRIGASRTLGSRHLTGHAVDLVPYVDIDKDGKVEFEEMYAWPLYHKLAPVIKAAAATEKVALVWGGNWVKFRDGPHWELDRRVYPAKQE
jgi:peptidoglycan L-alanyl-D-glutamate endopeptidase CwlK